MDKYCLHCNGKIIRAKDRNIKQWQSQKYCSRMCSGLSRVKLIANLRARKMAAMYSTGLFTLSQIAEMSGGISYERVRQILQKHRDLIQNYHQLARRNKQLGINKLLKKQNKREVQVISI